MTGSAKTSPPFESNSLTQPSSRAQGVRAPKRKKTTGPATTSPASESQSNPLAQPSSGAQVRDPKGKKTTGPATISATSESKSNPLTQPSSGAQVRAPKGKKMTEPATTSATAESESSSLIQLSSEAQVRVPKGKKMTGHATTSATSKSESNPTLPSSGAKVRALKGKKTTGSATTSPTSESESNPLTQQSLGSQVRASKSSTALGTAKYQSSKGSKNDPTPARLAIVQLSATFNPSDHEPSVIDEFSPPITLSDDDTKFVVLDDPEKTWIKELFLTKSDKSCTENPHGWLNDAIIHAAQSLLKCQSQREKSGVGGFQNPQYAKGYRFQQEGGKFVQVLHVSNSHWITISNIGCGSDSVNVFDSAYAFIDMDGKKQVCSLMKPSGDILIMDFVNIQHQGNGSDCGLFALACATDLVYG